MVGEAEGGVGSVLVLTVLWRRGGWVGNRWQNWQCWVPLSTPWGHRNQRGCAKQLVPTNHLRYWLSKFLKFRTLRYIQYETNRDYPKGFVRLPWTLWSPPPFRSRPKSSPGFNRWDFRYFHSISKLFRDFHSKNQWWMLFFLLFAFSPKVLLKSPNLKIGFKSSYFVALLCIFWTWRTQPP